MSLNHRRRDPSSPGPHTTQPKKAKQKTTGFSKVPACDTAKSDYFVLHTGALNTLNGTL